MRMAVNNSQTGKEKCLHDEHISCSSSLKSVPLPDLSQYATLIYFTQRNVAELCPSDIATSV